MLEKLATQFAYKIFALSGLLIALLTPYFGWQYTKKLETKAVLIFEQVILTQLDLESLHQQYQSIQKAISASRGEANDVNSVDYSESELEHLQAESQHINAQIEALAIDAGTMKAAKKAIITEVKLAFIIIFFVMLVSTLAAAFGLLGWYFHIRIYRERRSEFGEGRISDQ